MNNIGTTIDDLVAKIKAVRENIVNMVELDGNSETTYNLTHSLANIENALNSIKRDIQNNKNMIDNKKEFFRF